jgi:hypothetical protein
VQWQEFLLVSPHMPEMKLDGRDGLTVIQDAELATLCAVLNLLSLSYHGQILLCK